MRALLISAFLSFIQFQTPIRDPQIDFPRLRFGLVSLRAAMSLSVPRGASFLVPGNREAGLKSRVEGRRGEAQIVTTGYRFLPMVLCTHQQREASGSPSSCGGRSREKNRRVHQVIARHPPPLVRCHGRAAHQAIDSRAPPAGRFHSGAEGVEQNNVGTMGLTT
jgi:hypothetical protein